MKKTFILCIMALAAISLSAKPPIYDWNDIVTRCAFGSKKTLKSEMSRLKPTHQALLAKDVVKSISLFPNQRARCINRMSDIIIDLVEFSSPDVKKFVEMMAIDAIPVDMKDDVFAMIESKRKNAAIQVMPNANGGIEQTLSNLQSASTNSAYSVDRTTTDNMQSDIGVLRVPRSELSIKYRKKRSHANPSFDPSKAIEPTPYWLQSL